jgi:putative Mn2+ efflux pump MntP
MLNDQREEDGPRAIRFALLFVVAVAIVAVVGSILGASLPMTDINWPELAIIVFIGLVVLPPAIKAWNRWAGK